MASSRSQALHHSRSLSFPSESRPSTSSFNDNLSTVRSSEATVSSMSSMSENLKTLQNLYININDFLLSSHTSSKDIHVNQILDGYIRLLDACSSVKDLVSQTKHELQDLSSAMRRKDTNAIHNHISSSSPLFRATWKASSTLVSSLAEISKYGMFPFRVHQARAFFSDTTLLFPPSTSTFLPITTNGNFSGSDGLALNQGY